MKYLKTKAIKIYKLILEWELLRTTLKYVVNNLLLPNVVRQYALFVYSSLPLASSLSYLKLRCFFSNQPHSLLSLFKMNRVRLKYLMARGLLTGVKKASW